MIQRTERMDPKVPPAALFIFAAVFFWLVIMAGTVDQAQEVIDEAHYCRDVTLWNATDGDQGHPDYKGTFEEVCE